MFYYFLHWPCMAEWVAIMMYVGIILWGRKNKEYITRCAFRGVMPMKLKMIYALSIINSLLLIVRYPLFCLAWVIVGVCAYPVWCMIKYRTISPKEGIISNCVDHCERAGL